MKQKQYNIYKTTNLVNGKFYWGVHDSIDESDGYLGSGTVLRKAIKKYGKENFRRVTKLLYDTAKEAYEDEGFIVNKAMVENPMSYNMHPGGKGGSYPGAGNGRFGKTNSLDHRKKIGIGLKKFFKINPMVISEETKQKMRGKRPKISGENNPMYGKKHSEKSKRKQSESHKGHIVSEETKQKQRIKASDGRNKGQNNPNSKTNRERRRLAACKKNI